MRPLARRLVALLLTVAVLLGFAFGGREVFWCSAMQRVMPQCGCDHAADRLADAPGQDAAPIVDSAPCCEAEHLPNLPAAQVDSRTSAGDAPEELPAHCPVVHTVDTMRVPSVPLPHARCRERGSGNGPADELYILHCAQLI